MTVAASLLRDLIQALCVYQCNSHAVIGTKAMDWDVHADIITFYMCVCVCVRASVSGV